MTRPCLFGALVLAAASAAGCDTSEKKAAPQRPGAGTDADAAPASAMATVFLRSRLEGRRAIVDVIARNAERDVHGAAFRLAWAPERLGLVEARLSAAWSGSALRLAKEGLPGELVVVWSEKAESTGVPARDETILGTIELTVKGTGPVDVTFRPERSTLRDATGASIPVEWHGGEVAAPRE